LFRRLEEKDIYELYKMLNSCKDNGEYFRPHSFEKLKLKKLLREKLNHYFVLIINDKIIGYSMLRTFGIFPHPTFGGIIHKDHRGVGFGHSLLIHTLEKAKELNFEKVLLKVDEDNIIAINLYKKVGFKEIQKESNQYWMEIEL